MKGLEISVYQFKNYRDYLQSRLGEGRRTGQKQRLAEALNCQPAHLSQVLKGKTHLSVEHAFRVNDFFAHNEFEGDYFLNILQANRAGTVEMEKYFLKKAKALKDEAVNLKKNMSVKHREISENEKAVYYGDFHYALADVAASLPQVKTVENIARILDVELEIAEKVIQFLIKLGLVKKNQKGLHAGAGHIFLDKNSPHIKKHHLNMRLHGLRQLEKRVLPTDIRYATYFTLSEDDAFAIKQEILALMDRNLKRVEASKEETLYCNIIDFFRISTK